MTMSLCVCRIADLFPFDIFSLADLIKGKNEEKLVICNQRYWCRQMLLLFRFLTTQFIFPVPVFQVFIYTFRGGLWSWRRSYVHICFIVGQYLHDGKWNDEVKIPTTTTKNNYRNDRSRFSTFLSGRRGELVLVAHLPFTDVGGGDGGIGCAARGNTHSLVDETLLAF